MSLYVDHVNIDVSGEQANAIWKALDRMAATHPDGPYRAMLDRTCSAVTRAIREATFKAQAADATGQVSALRLVGKERPTPLTESYRAALLGLDVDAEDGAA